MIDRRCDYRATEIDRFQVSNLGENDKFRRLHLSIFNQDVEKFNDNLTKPNFFHPTKTLNQVRLLKSKVFSSKF